MENQVTGKAEAETLSQGRMGREGERDEEG